MRVKEPREDNWKKLKRLLKYLNGTREDKLILSYDNIHIIKWYVNSSYGVHPHFKSQTGGMVTLDNCAPITMSYKQKLSMCSSTDMELVAADDMSTLILWTKLFMEVQSYYID